MWTGRYFFEASDDLANTGTGHVVASENGHPRAHPVAATRLDHFFEAAGRFPDVVKIDVEGAELKVLQGMTGLFQRGFPRAILMEVHGFYFNGGALPFYEAIDSLLRGAGFTLWRLEGTRWTACEPPAGWPSRCHIFARNNRAPA
jgi:hypothetical protein